MVVLSSLTHQLLRPRQLWRKVASTRPNSSSVTTPPNRKQRGQKDRECMDWRVMFRSAEYDDAWSPYIPFATSVSEKTNDDHADRSPIEELLDGTWQRRRHGMNLVPFHMKLKWADSAKNGEIQQTIALYEGRLKWLDSQTRFLCSMLDDLYKTGIRRQIDRGRTERCHRIIGKLLTLTPPESSEKYIQLPFTVTGLAQRAASIVERMEKCSPVALQYVKSDQICKDGLQISDRAGSIRIPQHLPHTKHSLPSPTKEIYHMVLLMYAKESGSALIAQQAEDVVYSMIERYMQHELTTNQSKHKIWPTKENWDCVLKCWSISSDPDRAVHAHAFLRSWIDWNKHLESHGIGTFIETPDIHSYHLVLESCIVTQRDNIRAVQLSSRVAMEIWDATKESMLQEDFDSKTYFLILRSFCQISDVQSKSHMINNFNFVKKVFRKCCEAGQLTAEMVEVTRNALPNSEFLRLLGNHDTMIDKERNALPTRTIMQNVPANWISHAL